MSFYLIEIIKEDKDTILIFIIVILQTINVLPILVQGPLLRRCSERTYSGRHCGVGGSRGHGKTLRTDLEHEESTPKEECCQGEETHLLYFHHYFIILVKCSLPLNLG